MMKTTKFLATLFLVLISVTSYAQKTKPLFYKINIKKNIGSTTWVYLQNGLHSAVEMEADYVILHMNTYGGNVLEADSMRTAVLNSPIPVIAFIDNNAASAGALISIACDSIYMRSSANMGAATVVSGDGEQAPDKYQSYMRGIMRATAESQGRDTTILNNDTIVKWKRDPKIAEAMVDERVVIPGIADSTQVLTLTANQAVDLNYCEGIAENIDEIVYKYMGIEEYTLEVYNSTFYDEIKGFLTNSVVQAFLIMIIIGGIYFELKTPGMGFPTAIAITAAILYFTPLYLQGYAQSWEILIFVVGLILIVFEIFVIPGFGVTGVSGIFFVVTGLFLALIGNIRFNFDDIPVYQFNQAILTVIAGLGFGVGLIIYLSSRIGKRGAFRKVALEANQEGYFSVSMTPSILVGETGIAATVLRPSGKVLIEGEYYDAVSDKGFIEKGEKIIVKKYGSSQLYVVKVKE
ncbi:MAG: NfeD family protein [Dysgonamonadaceae bacterium]|nr:NfeD family protein [Dysgonamonadaceae bacterium]MDD4727503.1 NfeD family protein [Dysgonamonadaceae bacterium]